jgi:putative nucleotidyltransferase with HDIG domain
VIDVEGLTRQAGELEPLPAIVTRLAGLVARDRPDVEQIVDVIASDPGLAASLLRYVNASSTSEQKQITTCRAAVDRLGLGPVLAVAVAANLRRRIDRPLPQLGLAGGDLWRHSVATALVVEEVARATDVYVPPETAAAALLHDVGKPLLAPRLGPTTLTALELARDENGLSPVRAEAELLGVDHGELGAAIARAWKLPRSVVQGIRHHHEPSRGTSAICDVVHVANAVAKTIPGARRTRPDVAAGTWEGLQRGAVRRLGLSIEVLSGVANVAARRFDPMLAQYSTA